MKTIQQREDMSALIKAATQLLGEVAKTVNLFNESIKAFQGEIIKELTIKLKEPNK